MKQRFVVVAVSALALPLIASARASSESEALRTATTVGAQKNSASQPVPCTESRVQALVAQFIEAFNAGDAQRLDRLFAPPGDFLWYVVDGHTHTDRTTLVDQLQQEHRDGVQLRLTQLRFVGYSNGHGHFEFGLARTTGEGTVDYDGKGACICQAAEADGIAVWGMGRESTTVGKPAVVALTGAVGPRRTISLKSAAGARVTSVATGLFRITVRDRSRADNFHLSGPGVDKKTGVGFRGAVRWIVELSAGRYVYKSDRHKALRATFSAKP
jgi:hypothetical protein